jgi:dTDP-glucose 4,6-dehydratase
MPSVIVRPFNLFGPRQHLEKLIPRFITSVLLGEPLTVHGDGRRRAILPMSTISARRSTR